MDGLSAYEAAEQRFFDSRAGDEGPAGPLQVFRGRARALASH
jgi:hypothetical protein